MTTDLTWLTGDEPVSAVVTATVSADDGVTEISEAVFFTPGHVVRLTFNDEGTRLYVNGQNEEREDFMALLGAMEMLYAWPGQVQQLG